nr:MAG TPA: hypothetical protein [Caudoviricetes sp.]
MNQLRISKEELQLQLLFKMMLYHYNIIKKNILKYRCSFFRFYS